MDNAAPCGKASSCEACPFPDCTWDGVTRKEWDAAKEADAQARHFTESKLAAQKRAYREANREKLAAQRRAYREANREKLAAQRRAYYEANREKVAAQQRAYYEANRDRILANAKEKRIHKKQDCQEVRRG